MRFLLAVLLVLAFGVLAAGYAARDAFHPPSPAAPAATAAGSSAASVPTAAPGQVSLVIDEATLTREVNHQLAGQPLMDTPLGAATVHSLTVQLRNGQILASGQAQIGPTNLPVSVAGTVTPQSGQLRATLTDARMGAVEMPAAARQQMQQQLQSQVDQLTATQPVRVQSVTIADGKMTVLGTRA